MSKVRQDAIYVTLVSEETSKKIFSVGVTPKSKERRPEAGGLVTEVPAHSLSPKDIWDTIKEFKPDVFAAQSVTTWDARASGKLYKGDFTEMAVPRLYRGDSISFRVEQRVLS